MGLFDFLKGKNNPPANEPGDVYSLFSRYSEYLLSFMGMQQQENYSPIAAYEKPGGGITGYLYIASDPRYNLSVGEVVERMEREFEKRLAAGQLVSYTIFYHSSFDGTGEHAVATKDEELKAISVRYKSKTVPRGHLALTYRFDADGVNYTGIKGFTAEQNNAIFNTQLVKGKDYFQERVEIKPEEETTPAGVAVTKVTEGDLHNTWCGIFGFEYLRNGGGGDRLMNEYAATLIEPDKKLHGQFQIATRDQDCFYYKGITSGGKAVSLIPVIKTAERIPVRNKTIEEWGHVQNAEAIISGNGRETFGVTYFATDYAENREKYRNTPTLEMHLAGILFVLDKRGPDDDSKEHKLSDDFAGYMPNNDLAALGCFDFIGVLEDFTEVLPGGVAELAGFMMRVRLINNPDIPDFFTIDMFVNKTNMRFSDPEKGMKITGMFQLQGYIAG
jgi:hypothetical protein